MRTFRLVCAATGAVALAPAADAGTDIYFNPLTQSAVVAAPNAMAEIISPWQTPPGITQENLTSLSEAEGQAGQSMLRVPGVGNIASMLDMSAYDDSGRYVFLPHETPFGAGASRYDTATDTVEIIFAGDQAGANGDWSNDYAAFDPSTWTPKGTLMLAEEWSGEGRIVEILNPLAPAASIEYRVLDNFPKVSHEGLRFSADGRTLYFVDEWNSGSIYKFVTRRPGDYTVGQTFVLVVDAFAGNPADLWNDPSNASAMRTGRARWIPITDNRGNPLTTVDPYRNGPTNDPRENDDTRGGRPAADEVNGTPYGRPEDMEIGTLANGREVMYFAATSEQSIYAVEMISPRRAIVRLAASEADTPKNAGFPQTSGVLNSPDNLAQDALGNIYIIEDAPNGSDIGGDIWFMRDTDTNGVAESLDHFLSIQVGGSEATGMIFNPAEPTQFVVSVQHPSSTDLDEVPGGFGDALWLFDVSDVIPPPCPAWQLTTCSDISDFDFPRQLRRSRRR